MNIIMIETGGWGGLGHYSHCLCSALQRSGQQVTLLTHAFNYQLAAMKKTYKVVQLFRGDGFIADWKRLYSLVTQRSCKIIHFQSLLSTRRDWLAFRFFRVLRNGPRFIITVHNVLPHEVLPGERLTYKLLYRATAGLIVHSQFTRESLKKTIGSVSNKPTSIIPHGHYGQIVNNPLLSRSTALKLLGLQDANYIVFFGAIRPYKGVHYLLNAVTQVSEWPDDLKVLIAGKPMHGITEKELIRMKDSLPNSNRVLFKLEYLPDEHIPAIFKIAGLMVLPYSKIDQSGVLMAAMAAGRPVLCTPVGGFPETVNSEFGFMSSDTTTGGLKSALELAIRKRRHWAEMGKRALAAAETKFSWDKIAQKTINFYKAVYGRSL